MKEDFVTFELAKKLKEKGFNKPCVAYYIPNCSKLYFNTAILLKKSTVADCLFSNNTTPIGYICSTFIDAPIISQVLKWLREEKKISIEPTIHCTLKWVSGIYSFDDGGLADFSQYTVEGTDDTVYIFHDSYEQAALAGIEYVIDNLI